MFLRKVLTMCCVAGFVLLAGCQKKQAVATYNEGINIVPKPESIQERIGEFVLSDKTGLVVNCNDENVGQDLFLQKIKQATGFDLAANQKQGNVIELLLDESLTLNEEGYTLLVQPDKVTLTGKTNKGVFYGLQTLLQLLPAEIESERVITDMTWRIPAVKIIDQPRFVYRGMHLDVCRHFVPVDDVKKHLDMMAMCKLNKFHWHLTEDQAWRIEIKKYPLLTEIGSKRIEGEGTQYGGFYTQEQIKEVVQYAQERMIDVIPEIELPGHALAALTAYPQFSCAGGPFKVRNLWGVEPDVYCAGKEETFEFLSNVIDEVVALFPSEYFHIGGDECPKDRWKTCPLCQNACVRKA